MAKEQSRREFLKNITIIAADTAWNGSKNKAEAKETRIISPEDVSAKLNKYFIEKSPEMSNDQNAPENLLARVMMSEDKENYAAAVLIAWTVLNRTGNWQRLLSGGTLSKELLTTITNNKDFGPQGGLREYSSVVDPVNTDGGGNFRIIAHGILYGGLFKEYNFGQTSFFHPNVQDALFAQGRTRRNSADVIRDLLARGFKEIEIPGVNPSYVIFFKK